jgi:hypothetical protein
VKSNRAATFDAWDPRMPLENILSIQDNAIDYFYIENLMPGPRWPFFSSIYHQLLSNQP